MNPSSSSDGFTLMEVLVAISVLAIALVVTLQLFSGGLKSGHTADAYTQCVFHADRKIAEILLADHLAQGVETGRLDDGYTWRSEIEQVFQSEEESTKMPFDMFQVTVTVAWGNDAAREGKQVRLITLKLIPRDQEAGKALGEGG